MEFDTPSRFIRDIDPRLLQVDGGSKVSRLSPSRLSPIPSLVGRGANSSSVAFSGNKHFSPLPTREGPGESHSLREGTVIEHQRFGTGTVTRLEGTGDNEKATVEFRNAGTKQLLLKFARYKIVQP